ncbi:MAG: hypothetical protein B7X89_04565 [Sulfuricurvum sp. 17-40-25]|nr:MAG: hypothetical protein B7Y30_05270 [Campylobacterales bacterium 16-40-21]OZA03268.1 MAG: hypothetical protein B7X89_04565 [Sulfuricurvum sp. 17-40-25]
MDFGYHSSMKTAFIRIGLYGLKITLASLALAGILYILLFSAFGNAVFKPMIEKKLSTVFNTPITIDTFVLSHNALTLQFHDKPGNTIDVKGQFSLITLNLHALYHAKVLDTSGLNTIGLPLVTSGSLNGGYGRMIVQGSLNVFDGDVHYRLQLNRFKPADAYLLLMGIKYQDLMKWLEYPHQSATLLTGEVDLHGLNHRDIQGNVTLRTRTQNFSPSKLSDDNSSFDFLSLFTDEKGKIQPFHLNLTLKTSVDELGILEQFAMLPLRGNANLNAVLVGDQERLVLDAHTNIAKSSTRARLHWKRLRPSYIYLNVAHANANTLFRLFSLDSPIEGNIDFNAESTMAKTTAKLSASNGMTHPDILKRDYHLTQPQTRFNATVSAQALPKVIHYQGSFKSDLARIQIDNTTTHQNMLHDLLKAIP